MSLDSFVTFINRVPKHVEIYFAGMAEPFLNKRCSQFILSAHEAGHRVGIYTTLAGATLYDIEKIKHITFIHFCIHLPDSEGRMKFNIDSSYFEALIMAITVIPNCNFMQVGKMDDRIKEIVGDIKDASPGLFSRAGNLKHFPLIQKKGQLICSACGPKIDHNILLPNGDVLLCCQDYAQEHVIGNLNTMTYNQLFESDEYKRVMAGLQNENSNILCRRCEVSTNR